MPYYKCSECHHEWEDVEDRKCDWCGADEPIVLEEETPLSKLVRIMLKDPEKFFKEIEDKKCIT